MPDTQYDQKEPRTDIFIHFLERKIRRNFLLLAISKRKSALKQ